MVVLDGFCLNPGDLDWAPLERLGDLRVYDRTPPEAVLERARDAQAVLTNKTPLPGPVIQGLPDLAYIGVLATGFDVVDVEAARTRGVPVTNVPAYSTESVAQMTFAHILNLALRAGDHARSVREGRWCTSPDFCYWEHPLVELSGLTLGIVGYGRIGRAVARIGRVMRMRVLAFDPAAPPEAGTGVEAADLDRVFEASDVVSLHCPLTPGTRHLVDARRLARMKPTAFLVNTSRGPLVEARALADALEEGRLAGAGLDVLEQEPPPRDHPLLSARNCFITPHIAWATRAARERLLGEVVENVRAFLEGRPRNVVNP